MKSVLLSSPFLQIKEDPENDRDVMDPAQILQQ